MRSCTKHLTYFLAHGMDLRQSAFFLKDSIVDDYEGISSCSSKYLNTFGHRNSRGVCVCVLHLLNLIYIFIKLKAVLNTFVCCSHIASESLFIFVNMK